MKKRRKVGKVSEIWAFYGTVFISVIRCNTHKETVLAIAELALFSGASTKDYLTDGGVGVKFKRIRYFSTVSHQQNTRYKKKFADLG